jgi:hypothetical protein
VAISLEQQRQNFLFTCLCGCCPKWIASGKNPRKDELLEFLLSRQSAKIIEIYGKTISPIFAAMTIEQIKVLRDRAVVLGRFL